MPSIIFGLFGFVLFVLTLGFGWSILAGAVTLAFMTLPTIIRTSEEALRAVPVGYREVSLSLGASKWQTIRKVVLPAAVPGILTGLVLGLGRAIGETAAVDLHGRLEPAARRTDVAAGRDADAVGAFLPARARGHLGGERLRDRRRSGARDLADQRRAYAAMNRFMRRYR